MKKIMAWSKCQMEIASTNEAETMPATGLESIGTIKDKSSTLEASDGDTLEAKATGGESVAKEVGEGGYTVKTRIIEPEDELYVKLGMGNISEEEGAEKGELKVTTHVVSGDWALKVTPKNKGAKGIKAPKTHITAKPGWSEEEGNFLDLEFEILKGAANYWYSRFTTTAVLP